MVGLKRTFLRQRPPSLSISSFHPSGTKRNSLHYSPSFSPPHWLCFRGIANVGRKDESYPPESSRMDTQKKPIRGMLSTPSLFSQPYFGSHNHSNPSSAAAVSSSSLASNAHPSMPTLAAPTTRVTRLIIVRHGESTADVDNTEYQRVADWDIQLTPRGVQQARAAGRTIVEKYLKHGRRRSSFVGTASEGSNTFRDDRCDDACEGVFYDEANLAVDDVKTTRQDIDDAEDEEEQVYFYYSPFLRSCQTVQELDKAMGLSDQRVLGGREDPRLRPCDKGYITLPRDDEDGIDQPKHAVPQEQLTTLNHKSTNPSLTMCNSDSKNDSTASNTITTTSDVVRQWVQQRDEFSRFFYRYPQGESGADVHDRVASFLETFAREQHFLYYPSNTLNVQNVQHETHADAPQNHNATEDENKNNTPDADCKVENPQKHRSNKKKLKQPKPTAVIIVTHGITQRLFAMKLFNLTVETFENMATLPSGSVMHLQLWQEGQKKNANRNGAAATHDVTNIQDIHEIKEDAEAIVADRFMMSPSCMEAMRIDPNCVSRSRYEQSNPDAIVSEEHLSS